MSGSRAKALRKMAMKLWVEGNLEKDISFKSFFRKIKKNYIRKESNV